VQDLHAAFDALIGYLVGMTLIEVVLKPILIRLGKSSLKAVDRDASVPDWVVPDWLYEDPAESELQEPPFDR